jgi:hypothetical protein
MREVYYMSVEVTISEIPPIAPLYPVVKPRKGKSRDENPQKNEERHNKKQAFEAQDARPSQSIDEFV